MPHSRKSYLKVTLLTQVETATSLKCYLTSQSSVICARKVAASFALKDNESFALKSLQNNALHFLVTHLSMNFNRMNPPSRGQFPPLLSSRNAALELLQEDYCYI